MSVLNLPDRIDLPNTVWLGNGNYRPYREPSAPTRVILHTTETSGLPGYRSGRSAPHATYYPNKDTFYQHGPLNQASMSLVHPSGTPETNHKAAVQLEIVCYSAEWIVDRYPNTGRVKASELTDHHLWRIAQFIRQIAQYTDLKIEWAKPGLYGSGCSGSSSPCRMSWSEWASYNGVVGHRRVPGNSHWDPGYLKVGKIIDLAKQGEPHPPPPTDQEVDMAVLPVLRRIWPEDSNSYDSVRRAQALLAVAGYIDYGPVNFDAEARPDGKFGPSTEQAVKDFQEASGILVDGVVGAMTWAELLGA